MKSDFEKISFALLFKFFKFFTVLIGRFVYPRSKYNTVGLQHWYSSCSGISNASQQTSRFDTIGTGGLYNTNTLLAQVLLGTE